MDDLATSHSSLYDLLVRLSEEVLLTSVEPSRSLIAQGLDSLGAVDLLSALQTHGYDIAYERLLGETSLSELVQDVHPKSENGPDVASDAQLKGPIALTGPQATWVALQRADWKSWPNISLCLSIPASVIPATYLPAMLQSLSETNDAMRMHLTEPTDAADGVCQRILDGFQLPVQFRDAPATQKDAMRQIETFEGDVVSPFEPSTRALVMASVHPGGRHWICLTMHHVFSDRISMQSLARQLVAMFKARAINVQLPPPIGYGDYAVWRQENTDKPLQDDTLKRLHALLDHTDVTSDRPIPRLAQPQDLSIAPKIGTLNAGDVAGLETLAMTLSTTLPLLLHAVLSALTARLTTIPDPARAASDILMCHVVSNRESHAALQGLVGCLDTSVPVAVALAPEETLQSFCTKTRLAFAESYPLASDLSRGGWILGPEEDAAAALITRMPHINIVRATEDENGDMADLDIQEHPVKRVQDTRWGLLLRVKLPSASGQSDLQIDAFSEDPALAHMVQSCAVTLLRNLLAEPNDIVGDQRISAQIEHVISHVEEAALHVQQTAALLPVTRSAEAFIHDKLLARQQRWYAHDARFALRRDSSNRFVGTAANPFPFTQLDKLQERAFLESLGAPLPKLLHVIAKDDLAQSIRTVLPSLPDSFVIKPVGAGHSFGVTVVRDGLDLTRNGTPFDPELVTTTLSAIAARGYCVHEGQTFPFNFSDFLIEELVIDACGCPAPTDYKVFMIGARLLWIQLHFHEAGRTWVAFVDADFKLLPQPAWDPVTCWRTHGALVCTDQTMVEARKPACLPEIVDMSARFAAEMGLFVRLDWYADKRHGPLMGEITTFPHMLQPRSFYSDWANKTVKELWQDPDGVVPALSATDPFLAEDLPARIETLFAPQSMHASVLTDCLPPASQAVWASSENVSYGALHRYITAFELAPWGVVAGERVALWVGNGTQLAALLFAIMNRYVAMPFGASEPADYVAQALKDARITTLIVVEDTPEAKAAQDVVATYPALKLIALTPNPYLPLAALPERVGPPVETPPRRGDDAVLLLRTSGSTGAPKRVCFTLAKLMRAGAGIARSLALSSDDLGVSMLPLHHVGGISCNVVAPVLAGGQLRFSSAFNPKEFFEALAGPQGATWCYLVPAMWEMVLDYAKDHPELSVTRPWPRLRVIRSAGAALPDTVAQELARLLGDAVTVLPTYGMTEAMPITSPPLSYRLERPGSVGPALPGVAIEIVDPQSDDLAVLPEGQVGEITVKGPTVLDEYDQDEHSSASVFTPRGYFRTGDLGAVCDDGSGWLSLKGRSKDAINRGGETLSPVRIEDVLRDYPTSKGAQMIVLRRAHKVLGEDVAVAVAPMDAEVELDALQQWARQFLPSEMIPQTLVLVPALPMSDTGKLQRARFAADVAALIPVAQLGAAETYRLDSGEVSLLDRSDHHRAEAPKTASSADLALAEVLDVIGAFVAPDAVLEPDMQLVDAGINSLAAIEVVARLNARFDSALPSWSVSDHPTARALHAVLKDSATQSVSALSDSDTALLDSDEAAVASSQPMRILLLHGEAADADLMRLSMQATHWQTQLAAEASFFFMDAPHDCVPKPGFHKAAQDAGIYDKPRYRSWGATEPKSLENSLKAVAAKIAQLGGIDAIGGICDGALVAAKIASERPDLRLFLNLSSNPLSRLPASAVDTTWTVTCPSVHLLSPQDEMNTMSELMELPGRCQNALILQHNAGHAVPALTGELLGRVRAALGAPAMAPAVDRRKEPLSPLQHQPTKPEPQVRAAFVAVLGHEDFHRDDSFFDIGGNSLLALRLTEELERRFSIKFPIESLFLDGASVARLGARIDTHTDTKTALILKPLNSPCQGPNVYAFPPINGHLSDYLALGEALSGTVNLVGLSFPALLSNALNSRITIQKIARQAAAVIAKQQRGGTIDLVGYSASGVLAFETARILHADGHEVHSMTLIDAQVRFKYRPQPERFKYAVRRLRNLSRKLRRKQSVKNYEPFVTLHLRAQLASWHPKPLSVRHPLLFVAADGILTQEHVDVWRTALGAHLDVVPYEGVHESLNQPDIAQQIALALINRVATDC